MRNIKLLSSALVVMGVCLSATARADGDVAAAPAVQASPVFDAPPADDVSNGKPGLVVTGALLTLLGAGHVALGAAAINSAQCSGQWMCFADLNRLIGGVSIGIGSALALVGVPLIIYGATAKTSHPHAQIGLSPTGVSLTGTF